MSTHAQMRGRVIAAVAAGMRRPTSVVAAELAAAGPELPCGSQRLVRAGVKVARELGLDLKPSREIARHFKSVDGVAKLLVSLEQEEAAA
jgi:hypothetical protein